MAYYLDTAHKVQSMTGKTADIPSYLSSVEVAELLGVNVATVKRWTDAGKLACVKTAGGHRKFLMRHLVAFARAHEKYAQRFATLPLDEDEDATVSNLILHGDYHGLLESTLESALQCDTDRVQQIINGLYMIHGDIPAIFDRLLTPALHAIGERWAAGRISIGEEHLASQTIRDSIVRLHEIAEIAPRNGEKAFILTLGGELHDIPAKMVQQILEIRGFQTLCSGQSTPVGDTAAVFQSFHPQRVYLSCIYVPDQQEAQQQFDKTPPELSGPWEQTLRRRPRSVKTADPQYP